MNIAIDVLAILGPDSKNRGIGNYTISQLKSLFQIDKENRYFLLNFYEDTSLKKILDYPENVSEHYFYLGNDGFIGNNKDFKEIFNRLIKKFIEKNNIQVFYITSPFDPLISYDMECFEGVKTMATLYDIIPYIFKKRYLPNKESYKSYTDLINKLIKFDKILAISQSAKNDIIQHFKVSPDKIEVIYAGTEKCYSNLNLSNLDKEELKEYYGIIDEFIMCTGGDDDRKNIEGLIVAYSKMPEELINKYQLVIVCKLSQASENRYYELSDKHNIKGRVILTNFVPLEHLVQLYNLAYVVAFPSQYEGFGLPVVEAMACGTPVLTSDNSSLGEIAKGAAVLVNPFDNKDITRGLVEILELRDLNELIQKGYERIKSFTWSRVAQSTLDAIKTLHYEEKRSKDFVKKIAFFTPLPPIQSGISDYSVDILNGLSKYFQIDVYIENSYKPNCNFNYNITIHKHNNFASKKDEYHEIIYQMGNSEYHSYMIEYIKHYPGILVLHDFNLHGLLYFMAEKQKDFNMYKNFLSEDYARNNADNYVNEFLSGKGPLKIFELPCNGFVTNYAKKTIVHSDFAKKKLLEKDISRDIRKVLHYANVKDLDNNLSLREKYGITEKDIIISAFGHIHETKRVMPILKAFKELSDNYTNIKLYLVGKPSDSIKSSLKQYIKENNLDTKVVITGYTDLKAFEEYIDATDICLNLRYPYNGETSGSLMRILANGKCVLVNDLGSFSEIPSDCCIKIKSPEKLTEIEEVEMIRRELDQLITNHERINSIGSNARRFAEENLDIDIIVDQYKNLINNAYVSGLTDTKVKDLAEYLIMNKHVIEGEIYKISKTLAFIKEI